jgi:hypothetical protein
MNNKRILDLNESLNMVNEGLSTRERDAAKLWKEFIANLKKNKMYFDHLHGEVTIKDAKTREELWTY